MPATTECSTRTPFTTGHGFGCTYYHMACALIPVYIARNDNPCTAHPECHDLGEGGMLDKQKLMFPRCRSKCIDPRLAPWLPSQFRTIPPLIDSTPSPRRSSKPRRRLRERFA